MFKSVRGLGMFNGIEWQAPRQLRLKIPFEAFKHIHPAIFGQILVMQLFREHGIIAQICSNDFMVLKVVPPLVTSKEQVDIFVEAMALVTEKLHSSDAIWNDAMGLVKRTMI